MTLRVRCPHLVGMTAGGLLLYLLVAPVAAAHTHQTVGPFTLEFGWLNEPALVGQPNGVQLIITDGEHPVTDLGADDLAVIVSTAGQDSQPLPLIAAFDAEEGEGPLGEYHATLLPTAPGDYSFHVTGTIHDTSVDFTVASGPETFDGVEGSSDLEFPVKQPTLTEVGTRLDRIDGRIEALQSAVPAAGAVTDAHAAATAASAAADRALLIGVVVGGASLVLAVIAISMALRTRRPGAGSA